jgi:diguanylate cyclase (GGDEF)-like protein
MMVILRKRALRLIGSVTLVLIIALFIIFRFFLLVDLINLETDSTRTNVERSLRALNEQITEIDAKARDYAAWDDTYSFMKTRSQNYLIDNYGDSTLDINKLNFVLLIDNNGKILFKKGYNLKTDQQSAVPQGLLQLITPKSRLVEHFTIRSYTSGIVQLPEGPVILSSQPIVTSNMKGPIRGSLIMGRSLNNEVVGGLAKMAMLSIKIVNYADWTPPARIKVPPVQTGTFPVFAAPLNKSTVAGYGIVYDIYSKPCLVLQIQMPRTIYNHGKETLASFILALLIGGIAFSIVIGYLLERFILSRITEMIQKMWYIRSSGDLSVRVTVTGHDELSDLEREMNKMISALEENQQEIKHQAYHDMLTGLPNRLLFFDRLEQAIAQAKRTEQNTALLFIDLDRFKPINDTLGHSAGDSLLKAVADRLKGCTRDSDTVSRLGGDEFTVILTNIKGENHVAKVSQKIIDTLSAPFLLQGNEVFITPSIGISLFPLDGETAEQLVVHADIAMYQAKGQGNQYQFFTADMNAPSFERLRMENNLRRALEREEFVVYYQPMIDIKTAQVIGVEALIRWNHHEKGHIQPAEFICIAEETGLIVPIGDWVLRTACLQNKNWQKIGLPPLRLSVNLSTRHFLKRDLAVKVENILLETGLEPYYLELEITENSLMENIEASMATLERLREIGLYIAIDDFGSGYSSLSYLRQLPANTLKIDRSFLQGVPVDSRDSSIVESIIALGHSLNMKVIAEGVERLEQLEFLEKTGCDKGQGYYFGKPMPAEEFIEFYRKRNSIATRTLDMTKKV